MTDGFELWPHIVDVLRHYGITADHTATSWRPFRCPLPTHPGEDRRPSAAYHAGLNRFTCHACGERGTGNSFLRLMEGLRDGRHAEEWWAEQSGVEKPAQDRTRDAPRGDHADLFKVWTG